MHFDLLHERARDTLARVPLAERVENLQSVLRFVKEKQSDVVEILTEISDYRSVSYELEAAISALEGAVNEVAEHQPLRLTKMSVFMPSNMILYSYVLYLLVPSLFVRGISFRPSSRVKSQMARLHEMIRAVHRLPIELRDESQKRFLKEDVSTADLIVFTGTYRNAEEIRRQLGGEQTFVFFGQGINPVVVAPGANLGSAVADTVHIRLLNSGQDCLGPDVIFVHETLLPQFMKLLQQTLDNAKFSECADPEADYGPVVYDEVFESVSRYLTRNHTNIVFGGAVDFGRRRIEPTILLRWLGEHKLNITEFFSPIFNVVGYRDTDRVKEVLLRSPFPETALGASVYGDGDEITRILAKKHTVTVNTSLLSVEDGNRPFGGYGQMANYVSHRGELHVQPILLSKVVAELVTLNS